MVRLSKPLYLSAPIVSIVASIPLGVGVFFLMKGDYSGALPLILGIVGLLYSMVLTMILYYKMWESIQDGHARTSPGKAVGFLFIPFFSVYWVFQVLWGFSKDYNAYVDRYAINTRKLPEGLFLALSILPLTAWIPFLGIVTSIACLVVFMMAVSLICDAVNALPPPSGQGPDLQVPPGPGPDIGVEPDRRPPARPLSLYCVSGEFARATMVVPADGILIGRDPSKVNLVLAAGEISGIHARVMPDPSSAQLWLEDLNSSNGTFYSQRAGSGQEGESGWIRLNGKVLLSPGARFRLAVDGPEFEIRRS